MSIESTRTAIAALQRFGLGPSAGAIAGLSSDSAGALLAELSSSGAVDLSEATLPSAGDAARMILRDAAVRKGARVGPEGQSDGAPMMSGAGAMAEPRRIGLAQTIYQHEAAARFRRALALEIGFVERLVWFWSNHFCVSATKAAVLPIAGAFEREAIRPHVLGRFSDMLLAVETHPAMLTYLDNAKSVGPNSRVGKQRRQGINENLAREILELHTLGVRTVYSQQDVTTLAEMLTGWTVVPRTQPRGGEFIFDGGMHEAGARTFLGKAYRQAGFEQGSTALLDIARHPATARHVSTKLARHIVGDPVPPTLVEQLSKRFLETDGDLREIAKTLILAKETWEHFGAKIRRPMEWMVAIHRMTGSRPEQITLVLNHLAAMGEPLWRPPAPDGFPDDNRAWVSALRRQIEIAGLLAARIINDADPRVIMDSTLGPFLSSMTRRQIEHAANPAQGLAVLLMSPEILRR
jgi:uncharacterized protein (DUF1800 family)